MDPQVYDRAREADEQIHHKKRGGYDSRIISKRVKSVTADAIKPPMQVGTGHSIIVHYENCAGFRGRLLGILTVVDGRKTSTIKVWVRPLHDQVLLIMGEKSRVVKIETMPSDKWGDSLTRIEAVR